jgi:transmembrane sensor
MKNYTPEELIRKYASGTCTEEEKALVESWHLKELAESVHTPAEEQVSAAHERTREAIARHMHAARRVRVARSLWFRVAAAAVLLFVVGGLWFVVDRRNTKQPSVTQIPRIKDVAPGKDGAILTLADGRQVVLDSLGNGIVANQNGTQIVLKNGQLEYKPLTIADSRLTNEDSPLTTGHSPSYNTISTPRGRQFQVALPDGSKVWLNAASSLRYPTAFTGTERRVEVTGEVYFEVAPSTSLRTGSRVPFIVNINGKAEVEVLGTHFNINAYDDEDAIRTTLLEGKVKVTATDPRLSTIDSRLLSPGQQAQLTTNNTRPAVGGELQTTSNIDLDKIMAWKNGVFNFQDASLQEVMRQLARWYDIEVVYEKNIPAIEFEGAMNRGNPLLVVMGSLEKLGVHYRLDGRRLVVLP